MSQNWELPVERPITGTCIEAGAFRVAGPGRRDGAGVSAWLRHYHRSDRSCARRCLVLAEIDDDFIFGSFVSVMMGLSLRALNPGYAPLPLPKGVEAVSGVITQRAGRRRRDRKRYE